MALRYGFFDSEITGYDAEGMPIFDRAENSDFFASFVAKLISNGVLAAPADCFQVTANGSMDLTVRPGFAVINGRFAYDDKNYTLSLAAASSQYKRIDRVVIRVNKPSRLCEIVVKQGQPAGSPVAPDVAQPTAGDYFELSLATVSIAANQTQITQADVTDTRLNSDVCGIVTQIIDHLDTSVFYAQLEQFFNEYKQRVADYEKSSKSDYDKWFEALQQSANDDMDTFNLAFDEWFQHMKDQLSEDAAGALQMEVDALKTLVAAATSHSYTLDAKAEKWLEQEDGSFEQTFTVKGVTAETEISNDFYAIVDGSLTVDERSDISAALGNIGEIKTAAGQITLVCFSSAPEMDLSIVVQEVR